MGEADYDEEQLSFSDEGEGDGVVETSSDLRFSRFAEILCERGGMRTYKGADLEFGVLVNWSVIPLKTASEEHLTILDKTLKLLLAIEHRHVMRVLSAWITCDLTQIVLITQSCSGGTMKEYLYMTGRPRLKVLKHWGHQILSGLSYLHSLSPPLVLKQLQFSEIWVEANTAEVKLDLSVIGKLVDYLDYQLFGAPEYIAPELFLKNYTEKTDTYSFGIC